MKKKDLLLKIRKEVEKEKNMKKKKNVIKKEDIIIIIMMTMKMKKSYIKRDLKTEWKNQKMVNYVKKVILNV